MDRVKGVCATFIDLYSQTRSFYTGLGGLQNKFLQNMQAPYTRNYVFEFTPGVVRIQHLVTTPDEVAYVHTMFSEPKAIDKEIKLELFETKSIDKPNPNTCVKLPRHEVKSMDAN